ncbi:hypothetical protein ACLOJK_016840 [Asimina triloba]
MSVSELTCTYVALLLHDDGIPITTKKITIVINAAGVKVESYWPSLFTKLLQNISIDNLITNVGSGGGGAPIAASAPAGGGGVVATAAPATEEKEEEPKEESDLFT